MAIKLPGGWTLTRPGDTPAGTELAVTPSIDPGDEMIEAVIVDTPTIEAAKPSTAKAEKPPKRSAVIRILDIGLWGWLKLVILCILIGSVILLIEETQRATQDNIANAAGDAARQIYSGAIWAVRNFWQPALAGAAVVIPIWVLWRLITLPFRK